MTIQILLLGLNAILGILGLFMVPSHQRYFLNPVNTFWLVFLYFSVLQPASNLDVYNARFGDANVTSTLFAFSLSAVFLYLGNVAAIGSQIAQFIPTIRAASRSRLNLVALLLLILSVVLTLTMIGAYGGLNAYLQRANLRMLDVDISDYIALGPRIATFAVLVGLATHAYYRKTLGTAAYALLAVLLLLWSIYQGSRSSAILLSAVLWGCAYAPRMRSPSAITTIALTIFVGTLIGFMGAYRSVFNDFAFDWSALSISEAMENSIGFLLRLENTGRSNVSLNEDFGMAAAVVTYVPSVVDYNYGHMFLQLFTQWIPLSLWPSKIYPDGEAWHLLHGAAHTSQYINAAGYLAGPAPTIVGKYYYSLGFFGVALGSFLSGVMLKVFWSYTLRLPDNIRPIFLVCVAPIGFMEANNPSLWLTFWLPTAGVTLALVLVLARISVGSRRVPTRA